MVIDMIELDRYKIYTLEFEMHMNIYHLHFYI